MEKYYYEVFFGNFDENNNLIDETSICIIGTRKPTIEEANEFCKKDLDLMGYEKVFKVNEIDKEYAYNFFYMELEDTYPIFS